MKKFELSAARSAKFLIIGTMFFAVISKLLSPGYLNGDFFRFALLTDGRFKWITGLFLDSNVIHENNIVLSEVKNSSLGSCQLRSWEDVKGWSLFLTYWTVLI